MTEDSEMASLFGFAGSRTSRKREMENINLGNGIIVRNKLTLVLNSIYICVF